MSYKKDTSIENNTETLFDDAGQDPSGSIDSAPALSDTAQDVSEEAGSSVDEQIEKSVFKKMVAKLFPLWTDAIGRERTSKSLVNLHINSDLFLAEDKAVHRMFDNLLSMSDEELSEELDLEEGDDLDAVRARQQIFSEIFKVLSDQKRGILDQSKRGVLKNANAFLPEVPIHAIEQLTNLETEDDYFKAAWVADDLVENFTDAMQHRLNVAEQLGLDEIAMEREVRQAVKYIKQFGKLAENIKEYATHLKQQPQAEERNFPELSEEERRKMTAVKPVEIPTYSRESSGLGIPDFLKVLSEPTGMLSKRWYSKRKDH